MSSTSKRKKWSEVEERTLIDKYGAMVSDGTLAKMKTREKKFKPIALYVNSMYHNRDPVSYPWQWSWKDVSTKVQNMRHQYLLVKQKIKKPGLAVAAMGSEESGAEEFDWPEGPTHWSNFLRYKEVFGDVPLTFQGNDMLGVVVCAARSCGENTRSVDGGGDHRIVLPEFGNFGQSGDGDFTAEIDGGENGVMALRWCDGEEGEENFNGSNHNGKGGDGEEDGYLFEEPEAVNGLESKRKKKPSSSMSSKEFEKKAFGFLANQLSRLKEMEARFELLEEERENERHQRESLRAERERDRSTEREEKEKEREERVIRRRKARMVEMEEWRALEKKSEEREVRRREESMIREREWEERMNQRRMEWRKQVDEMLEHHRTEMGQMQSRILHEHQSVATHLLGIVSQWAGHPAGLSDHTGASSHYLSQMMQNLHQGNEMVHGDTNVDGDHQDDQFIVDDG